MKTEVKMLMTAMIAILLASGAGAETCGAKEKADEQIAIKDLPTAVVQTVKRVFPQGVIKKAEKEEEDGKLVYDVEVMQGETLYSIETAADGSLIEVKIEKDDDDDKEGDDKD